MRTDYMIKSEQDKVVELMCQILELNEVSEKTVIKAVKEKGLRVFFQQADAIDIEEEERERLYALKEIIETKEQEILKREGAEGNGDKAKICR